MIDTTSKPPRAGGDATTNTTQAREIYARFDQNMDRGHRRFVQESSRLNDFYLGGGRQWLDSVRAVLESEGRPCVELNLLLAIINAAVGYQINNRMEISYAPRGGRGDSQIAKVLSKLSKSALDGTNYRYHETDVFLDGLVMRRGWFDVRVNYDSSLNGDLDISVLDPRDVMPDPDATSYDPDQWYDCLVSRFYTADEARRILGEDVADALIAHMPEGNAAGWGTDHEGDPATDRRRFGDANRYYGRNRSYLVDGDVVRYRLLHRQINEWMTSLVAVWPDTQEVRVVEGMSRETIQSLIDNGVFITRRKMRRVRWIHAAPDFTISNEISPYPSITTVPYFPLFRRGESIGLVDNAMSPQELLNKVWSSFQHILSSTANSGWQGEAGALANMTDEQFTEEGASTGLVLLRKPGYEKFEKIQPNPIPQGLDRLLQMLPDLMQKVVGVNESLMGQQEGDISGIAVQSLQHAAQQQLALPLDNLARTRRMIADRTLWIYQNVFTMPRVVRYTELDVLGRKSEHIEFANLPQPDGSILNDLTLGEYDVTINEVPLQATFENSQFQQGIEMKKAGAAIPDEVLVRYSNLLDKEEIIEMMQASRANPGAEAEAELKRAQAKQALANATKLENEAVAKSVEAQFSGIRTAQVIALMPDTAPLADALLRSAGYVDRDAAPIVPTPAPGMPALPAPAESSNPLTPPNPEAGLTAGMTATPETPAG